jgi:putative restriction endonuclease
MNWTRDQLLIVLNLYHKIPFGLFDKSQKVIVDLAAAMKRTPGSVAMKLSNFASLDPALQLRGIKGLSGASKLDREMWTEFHANLAELVPLSQEKFDSLFLDATTGTTEVIPGKGILPRPTVPTGPTGPTEITSMAKRRLGQHYFREMVLNNYASRCALTGLPIRELLIASHILPWSSHESERLNVRNGIALNRLHDAAFDQGLIGFDDDLQMILSTRLRESLPQRMVFESFEAYEAQALSVPEDGFAPDPGFVKEHRVRFGLG